MTESSPWRPRLLTILLFIVLLLQGVGCTGQNNLTGPGEPNENNPILTAEIRTSEDTGEQVTFLLLKNCRDEQGSILCFVNQEFQEIILPRDTALYFTHCWNDATGCQDGACISKVEGNGFTFDSKTCALLFLNLAKVALGVGLNLAGDKFRITLEGAENSARVTLVALYPGQDATSLFNGTNWR